VKILYLSQWFSASGGGGEVLFMELASGMSKRGHIIHVLSHALENYQDRGIDNIQINRIKPVLHSFPPSYFQT